MMNIGNRILKSSLFILLFWIIIGLTIHVWVAHGQDASFNILHVQNGPLIRRLVHFSYIFVGYAIYHVFHWTAITALQALGMVSVLSMAIGGWSVYQIGYHLNGRLFGWALSLLVWPLPILILQSQGQEYQPFATSMMILSWYYWIVHKSVLVTSVAWAVSVLANPANAFLFPSFTGFSLLENKPFKAVMYESVRLWFCAAAMVVAVWAPFYKELLFANDGWAVAPTLGRNPSRFDPTRLFRAGSFFLYSVLSNFFIIVFAIPFKNVLHSLKDLSQQTTAKTILKKALLFASVPMLTALLIFTVMGSASYGRYYTPLLHWLALLSFIGIYQLMNESFFIKLLRRWFWIGIIQLSICFFLIALPYKQKAYSRYEDYQMLAEKHHAFPVACTGAMNMGAHDKLEKRLQLFDLDHKDQADRLINMLESGRINSFILVYGIDTFDRALLKRLLPRKVLELTKRRYHRAEDTLRHMGFKVNIKPMSGVKSGRIYWVEPVTKSKNKTSD